ncbi:MAG: tetratricopeptide repeat protein [Acidobacteria bacterium]|nr:tetratricopeptide repeat protein [Acidobacteriota bacterium]
MTASNRRKLLGAIAAAGIVSAPLLALMNKPKPRPAARAEVPVAANPAADRAHEMKSLEAELQKKPDHAPILFRMAQLARELGKPAEAAQHLEQILKAEPDHPEALLELGRTLFESGDVQGAIARTNRLLAINPTQVDALYNLGAIYGNLNQPDQARQYWQRAVAAGPASESGLRAKESLARLSQ